MATNFGILILIWFIIGWRNREFNQLERDDKGLNMKDLLKYIRGVETRIIILFIGIFIMFMGLRYNA